MKGQITIRAAVAAAAIALGACTPSKSDVDGELQGYTDSQVNVASAHASGMVEFANQGLTLTPHAAMDVISGATPRASVPDTVSRATEFDDTRTELGLDAQWAASPDHRFGAGTSTSVEDDYLSFTGKLNAAFDFFDHNTTLSLSGLLTYNLIEVENEDDGGPPLVLREETTEKLMTPRVSAGLTQVLSPDLLAHLEYTFEHRAGFQSSPYRAVAVYRPGSTAVVSDYLTEQNPDQRSRHAAEGLLSWHVGAGFFLRGRYRFYVDDWGILSHTITPELWSTFADDALRLRLQGRYYTQTGSDFYASRYEQEQELRTGDFKLSAMSSMGLGARSELRVIPGSDLAITAGYDLTRYAFEDFAVRDAMVAHILTLGLSTEL